MKFCKSHWDALRAAVDARGMTHLVAKSGAQAFENVVLELEGREREAHFDPLMAAHNMILGHAMDLLGLVLFTGDYCPACELLKRYPPIPEGHRYATNESYMIDGPVDAVLEIAREQGLMPKEAPDAER